MKLVVLFFCIASIAYSQKYQIDTALQIQNTNYRIYSSSNISNDFLYLQVHNTKLLIDTVYLDAIFDYSLIDFNLDGNKDILIAYAGNNTTYNLYLFDPLHHTFRKIEGYDKYPESKMINKSKQLYYSYNRAGCADLNWESSLITIQDYVIIQLGYIYGNGCGMVDNQSIPIIKIFKIIENSTVDSLLVEEIEFSKMLNTNKDKWDFIDSYWNDNYIKFITISK